MVDAWWIDGGLVVDSKLCWIAGGLLADVQWIAGGLLVDW